MRSPACRRSSSLRFLHSAPPLLEFVALRHCSLLCPRTPELLLYLSRAFPAPLRPCHCCSLLLASRPARPPTAEVVPPGSNRVAGRPCRGPELMRHVDAEPAPPVRSHAAGRPRRGRAGASPAEVPLLVPPDAAVPRAGRTAASPGSDPVTALRPCASPGSWDSVAPPPLLVPGVTPG